MTINRRSLVWRIAARLALAVLLTDIAGAAAIHPNAATGLFADLAWVCRTGGEPQSPAQSTGDICVFCLPLVGGCATTPAEFALSLPARTDAFVAVPADAGFVSSIADRPYFPRGPPSA